MKIFFAIVSRIYDFFWGDLFSIPLPGGQSLGISLLVAILIPAGLFFTIRTRFVPIRMLPEMFRLSLEKRVGDSPSALSGIQTLIVSTATRVGMGNMVGVVAAISAGGAGAVFWMWLTALIGASTAFVEATLAHICNEPDPLYGGFRGGPAYYIHRLFAKSRTASRYSLIAVLFALSGLLCWCGVSQVISNSVSEAFYNAFQIPPIVSTCVLVSLAALIVLGKNATVKVLDVIVPIMAFFWFGLAIFVIVKNAPLLPSVFARIWQEAFGLRQAAAGGFGAALMNGVKRGLFSNEAGSGSAPCAAAAADVSHSAKAGLFQSFGVLIDTIVICSCTAFLILLAPQSDLEGMALLQSAMAHHFGSLGVYFSAAALWLFSFSTFIGILFYARSNVAYLFGDKWFPQTLYKLVALAMLFCGGLSTYTFVWELGDIGIALMTIFNMLALIPMSGRAIRALQDYTRLPRSQR